MLRRRWTAQTFGSDATETHGYKRTNYDETDTDLCIPRGKVFVWPMASADDRMVFGDR